MIYIKELSVKCVWRVWGLNTRILISLFLID